MKANGKASGGKGKYKVFLALNIFRLVEPRTVQYLPEALPQARLLLEKLQHAYPNFCDRDTIAEAFREEFKDDDKD